MKELEKRLFEMGEEKYADFQFKLTPTVPREAFIGIRVPILRKFAKAYFKEEEHNRFLKELPHKYYDENMLHGLLIEQIKDFDECVDELNRFLPFVDNWAVCDIMSPKILKKHKSETYELIKKWAKSDKTYTIRFGVEILMSHYLDDDFKPEVLEIPAKIVSDEYYVNMMIAWFYATALAKQWDETICYLEEKRLPDFVHKKTIRKACESYRITDEQKQYLKTLL